MDIAGYCGYGRQAIAAVELPHLPWLVDGRMKTYIVDQLRDLDNDISMICIYIYI